MKKSRFTAKELKSLKAAYFNQKEGRPSSLFEVYFLDCSFSQWIMGNRVSLLPKGSKIKTQKISKNNIKSMQRTRIKSLFFDFTSDSVFVVFKNNKKEVISLKAGRRVL